MSFALANILEQDYLHLRVWREENVYIAKCLDIPGCVSEGATREEALANLDDAITLCLQVIREDAAANTGRDGPPHVELIARPIEDFLHA